MLDKSSVPNWLFVISVRCNIKDKLLLQCPDSGQSGRTGPVCLCVCVGSQRTARLMPRQFFGASYNRRSGNLSFYRMGAERLGWNSLSLQCKDRVIYPFPPIFTALHPGTHTPQQEHLLGWYASIPNPTHHRQKWSVKHLESRKGIFVDHLLLT